MFDKNEFGNEHSLSDNDYFQYLIECYYSNRVIEEGEKSDESRKKENPQIVTITLDALYRLWRG